MSRNPETTRWLLALQGYSDVPDGQARAIDYGLRTGPVFCMTLAAVGTVLASPGLLLALSGIAALGALLGSNAFDVFYNHGLRHALKGPRLPVYPAPRRFACAVAAAWLVVTAGLMLAGFVAAGSVMGWIMVAMAGVPVATGFCIPSFTFRVITKTLPVRRGVVENVS
jgi:hypothetical protein